MGKQTLNNELSSVMTAVKENVQGVLTHMSCTTGMPRSE